MTQPYEGRDGDDDVLASSSPAGPVQPDPVDQEMVDLVGQLDADAALVDDVAGRLVALELELAERTADVQRVHAEYANYRKRVDRDREVVRDNARAELLTELLTILDDIDRAEAHDELVGGFRSVGEGLRATVTKLGLERYGVAGEPFDPVVHEALTHMLSNDVIEPVCIEVFQPGYRIGERIVRPARVAVAEPQVESTD
jgi:molecular chaperone GrpE